MKKMALILTCTLIFSLFLTACDKSNSDPISDLSVNSTLVIDNGSPYNAAENHYNSLTAVTSEYIFLLGENTIYRINRADNTVEHIVTSTDDLDIAWICGITVYDDHIYFLSIENSQEIKDETAQAAKMSICRMDLNGENINKVVFTDDCYYTIFFYNEYIVLEPYFVSELYPREEFTHFFIPSSSADILQEIPRSDISTQELDAIASRQGPPNLAESIRARLHIVLPPEFSTETAIKANDAYYYYTNIPTPTLYRVPFSENDDIVAFDLPPDFIALTKDMPAFLLSFVNYDDEWLYLVNEEPDFYRIKKDGTQYQICTIPDEDVDILDHHYTGIQVVDNLAFFYTSDGKEHMLELTTLKDTILSE